MNGEEGERKGREREGGREGSSGLHTANSSIDLLHTLHVHACGSYYDVHMPEHLVVQVVIFHSRRTLSTPCTQRGGTPHHVWFQLEVTVDPAPPDQVIPVTCPTLSSTITHLPITNTLSQPLQLSVSYSREKYEGCR